MIGSRIPTNREIRIAPKKELTYLAALFGFIILLILIGEFLVRNEVEFASVQSKTVYGFFILLICRLFTFSSWGDHYKETLNVFSGHSKFDEYSRVSLFSVSFDIFMISVLFFWVEIDKVSFVRVPIAGLVYVLLMGFSMLKKKRVAKKI